MTLWLLAQANGTHATVDMIGSRLLGRFLRRDGRRVSGTGANRFRTGGYPRSASSFSPVRGRYSLPTGSSISSNGATRTIASSV
jgi:hypothetical protein